MSRSRNHTVLIALAGIAFVPAWALALVVQYVILTGDILHGPVRADTLGRSVASHTPSAGTLLGGANDCEPAGREREWTCGVMDSEGSGGVDYRVVVEPDSSCWSAQLVRSYGEGAMPEHASGCVHRREWTLSDFIP